MSPNPQSLLEHLPLHDLEIERRKALVGLSADDATCLARIWPSVQPAVEPLVAAHQRRQLEQPDVARLMGDQASHAQLQHEMAGFVASLFGGCYDSNYANGRLRIGFMHRRIGLPARYFVAALHHLHVDLRRAITTRVPDTAEAGRAIDALERLLRFDESLILDAYEHRLASEARREHNRALRYAASLEDKVAERTRELEQLSHTDALTGLGNRRAFLGHLSREVSRARRQRRPLSAVYLDLDGFKCLNDREGHARGDQVLAAVASTLSGTLREVDIAARLGGDEFCVLLPDTDDQQAAAVAERLRERIAAACPVTASIGTATLEQRDLGEPEALIRRADAAMYREKRRGAGKLDHAVARRAS